MYIEQLFTQHLQHYRELQFKSKGVASLKDKSVANQYLHGLVITFAFTAVDEY